MTKENTEKSLEKIKAATHWKMRYANSSDNCWKTSTGQQVKTSMTEIHPSAGLLSASGIISSMSKLTKTHVNQSDKHYFRRSRSEVGIKQCRNEKINSVVSTGKKQSPMTIKSPQLLQKTRKLPLNSTSRMNTINKQILTGNRSRRHKSASLLNRKQPILIIVLNESRRGDYPEKKYHTFTRNCVATSVNVEKENMDVIRGCEEKPQYSSKTVVIVNEKKISLCKPDLLKRQLIQQSTPENILLSSSQSHNNNIGDDFFKLILIANLIQYTILHSCQTEISSDILSENMIGEDLCSVMELHNLSVHQPQYHELMFEESSAVYIAQVSAGNSWIEDRQISLQSCTDEQHNEPTAAAVPTNTVIYITLIDRKELKNRLSILQQVEEQYKGEQVTQTISSDNVNIDDLIVTPLSQTCSKKHQEVNITEKISEQPATVESSGISNLELLKSHYEKGNFVGSQFSPDVPQRPLVAAKDHSQINNISDHHHYHQSVEVRRFNRKTDTASGFSNWLVKFINSGCIIRRKKQKPFPRKSVSDESILPPVSQNINAVLSLKDVSYLLSLLSNTDEHKYLLNTPEIKSVLLNVQHLKKLKHEGIDLKRISKDESQDFTNKLLHSIKTQIRFSDEDAIHEDNQGQEDCTNISEIGNRKSNSLSRGSPVMHDAIKTLSEYKPSSNDKRQVAAELKEHCKQQANELCDARDRHLRTVDFASESPSSVSAVVHHQKQETPSALTDKTDQPIMRHKYKYLKQIKQKQLKKKASTNITNLLLKLIDRKRQNIVHNNDSQCEQRERIVVRSLPTDGTLHPKEKDNNKTSSSTGYAGNRKSGFLVKQKPTVDVESEEDNVIREYHLRDSTIFPRSRSETTVGNKPDQVEEVQAIAIISVDNTLLETALETLYISTFETPSTQEWDHQTSGMFIVISDRHKVEIQAIKRHDHYIHEPDTMKFVDTSNRQIILQLQPVQQDINNLQILERMQDSIQWMLAGEEQPPEQNYLMCTISLRLFSKLETGGHEQLLQIEDELSSTLSESIIKHQVNSLHSFAVYRPSYRCCPAYSRIPFSEPPGLYHCREDTNTHEDEADDATCLTGSLVSFLGTASSDKILDGDNSNKDDRIQYVRHYNSMTEASIFNDNDESDDSFCLRHHSSSDQQLRLTKINPVLAKPVNNNLKAKKMQFYFPILLQRETGCLFQSVELSKTDSNETPTATMTVITMPIAEMNSVSSCKYIQY
ncbi:unnamed protein product [Trichobilharzia szidati]|nr:unnamed protein product [Trichobilharzia szidati]